MILSECYQQIVNLDPVLGRKLTPQHFFRLVGGFGRNISEAVANAVDVGIYANPRFAETESHDQIGSLASDPLESKQLIDIVRYGPVVLIDKSS